MASCPPPPKKKKSVQTWLEKYAIKDVITSSKKGAAYAYCKVSNSDFNIQHVGSNDITRHTEGATHKKRLACTSSMQSLHSMFNKKTENLETIRAVAIMVDLIVKNNVPLSFSDKLNTAVKTAFKGKLKFRKLNPFFILFN